MLLHRSSERTSIDLLNAEGGFASIEISADRVEVYIGEYVDFDDLKLDNLRPVPGWNAEVAEEKNRTTALACPHCGAAVQLRAAGLAMSAVCGSCGVVIDTSRPEVRTIQNADVANRNLAPILPIGQRGRLFGTEYEVIGFVTREDRESNWSEYLLFNPWQGFRWLVTFEGHWSFIERVPTISDLTSNAIEWQDRDYKFYAKNRATVTGVLGEFYWKVRRGEDADVCDYIAPPYILSKETYPGLNEFAWSHGIYVEPRLVADAFGVKDPAGFRPGGLFKPTEPLRRPVAGNPPPIFRGSAARSFSSTFISCKPGRRWNSRIAQFTFPSARGGPNRPTIPQIPTTLDPSAASASSEAAKPMTTPHFSLAGPGQRVTIEAGTNVENSWLDLDFTLVNVQTNQSFPAEVEVSYYYGSGRRRLLE